MKTQQLYYTSCENGFEKSPGFQIKAISKNFNENYIPEFKTFGSYKAPSNFPSQPTEEEIKTFPISFKYKKKDEYYLFVKTTYVGKDFTAQRYGNYFLHGILLENLEIWPVDLYCLDIFKSNDDKNHIFLEELNIEINENKIKEYYNYAVKNINKEILKKMLKALFLSKKDKRPLLIKVKNDKEALNYLICLEKIFPLNFAKNITFSSYQSNYNNLCDINFTIGESDLTLDFNDFNYNFYLFDIENKKYSEIKEDNSKEYEKIIEFMEDMEFMYKFYEFSNRFNIKEISDLNFIFKLFLVLNNNIKISNDEILELFNIVSFVKLDYKKWVINELLNFIQNIDNLSGKNLYKVIEFYSIIYEETKEEKYKNFFINNLYKLYLETLDNIYSKTKFNILYNEVIKNIILKKDFQKYVIKDYNLILNKYIKSMDDNDIIEFFNYISLLDEKTLYGILIEVLQKTNKISFEILNFFQDKNKCILYIIKYNTQLSFDFLEKYYSINKNDYFKLIKFIYKKNGNNFLELQFQNFIPKITYKIDFFDSYIKCIENKTDKENFLEIFWKNLSLNEKKIQLLNWNKSGELNKYLNTSLKEVLIIEINNNISFEKENNEFDNLLENLENFRFNETANKIFLRRTFLDFKENDLEKIEIELKKLKKYNLEQYKNYLIQLYSNIKISDLKEFYKRTFFNNPDERIVFEVFDKIILEKENITQLDNRLILFLLEMDNSKGLSEKIINDIIIKKIIKFDKMEIGETKGYLLSCSKEDTKDTIEDIFNRINELLIPTYKKILNKVSNVFNKIKNKG